MTLTPQSADHPVVFSKYKAAADILNKTLTDLLAKCLPGANVHDLCVQGDQAIELACTKIYNKGNPPKGVAFPTCISMNDCICHYSPKSDEGLTIQAGDLVKIELGAHIDSFPVLLAHSILVPGEDAQASVSEERTNLLLAAHTVSELALRYFTVGRTTQDVSTLLERAISDFGYHSVQGTISFELSRDTLGASKYIIVSATPEQKKASNVQAFEPYDVFAVDVALTSGDGSFVPSPTTKPWIYRKTESTQSIKTKSGRTLYSAIQNKFGRMAFHLRSLQPPAFEKTAKLGISELENRQLIQGYETLYDRVKKPVARFMFTVIVTPTGPIRITHWHPLAGHLKPTNCLKQPDLLQLLATDPRSKSKH